jgi:hypothetical protein
MLHSLEHDEQADVYARTATPLSDTVFSDYLTAAVTAAAN